MAGRSETLSIRVRLETKEALRALAAADKRPLADYVSLLLDEHVEQMQAKAAKPKRKK